MGMCSPDRHRNAWDAELCGNVGTMATLVIHEPHSISAKVVCNVGDLRKRPKLRRGKASSLSDGLNHKFYRWFIWPETRPAMNNAEKRSRLYVDEIIFVSLVS